MKKGRTVLGVLGLLAAMAAAPAAAQERFSKFYVGGSLGGTEASDICDDTVGICSASGNFWRVFAGYRLNRNVAFEVGFMDLGHTNADGVVAGVPGTIVEISRRGVDYTGVLSFELSGRLHGFGRLGAYTMRTTTEGAVAFVPGISESAKNTGFTFGAGLGYDLGFLGFRAEWQKFVNVGSANTSEDTIDAFSAGILLRF